MSAYLCTFERIGRTGSVPPLTVEAGDADEIAYHVYTYARRFLRSQDVQVTVNLETMRGSINAGRFGTFRLASLYHVVCKNCGRRSMSQRQPRECETAGCEAAWMDLPQFADKADADRVADALADVRL